MLRAAGMRVPPVVRPSRPDCCPRPSETQSPHRPDPDHAAAKGAFPPLSALSRWGPNAIHAWSKRCPAPEEVSHERTAPRRRFLHRKPGSRDPEIFAAIEKELGRQRDEIELIASENIVSAAVMAAQGSVMTNKYAEGYPGRRYYGGCEFVDIAENLAIDRAKALFDCGFANVQPNSGSQANQGVFQALLQPGDTILGMSLDAGGHLTHGAKPNQSGKWFNAIQYGVRQQDC
jgi:hypothetical protein